MQDNSPHISCVENYSYLSNNYPSRNAQDESPRNIYLI